ncbi:beta-ketoacyl synthase N-terminal-like domain-containing protein [Dactylosporangium sp. CS-033363]|uniref:beta-ketoacyl synthase N-terminal-like domain-containing protein n=1 Tax=Dactylosporangium sp. CS-033363 TaxID=3239935 RepID=UPI003D92E7F6
MSVSIAASAVRTCLGAGPATFDGLLAGACGAGPLRSGDPDRLNVATGYHIGDGDARRPLRAGALLRACLAEVVAAAGLDPGRQRVAVLVGTGLRELSAVESAPEVMAAGRLDFADVVAGVLPQATEVLTVANACSAGGHVLALAQDLLDAGDADAVVVAAADTSTQSMLSMIGRVAPERTDRVRPFDRDRGGVLLGDGAAALVLVPPGRPGPVLGRVLATGLSCDAAHPTAPDVEGITRAVTDAYRRAGREPADTGTVVAHGTGTALNDPTECAALRAVLPTGAGGPVVTAVKGAVGHTSGAAALINVDVALRSLAAGVVPAVVGLRTVLPEGEELRFVRGEPQPLPPGLVQSNAFGFGGVNAVTLLEAP